MARVLAIAVTARRRARVVELLGQVAAAGGEPILLTAGEPRVEPSDEQHDQQSQAFEHVNLEPAPIWRPVTGTRVYRAVRPWVLWRAARRHLDRLDPQRIDHLLLIGTESWPIAWHLLRLNPALTYGFDLPVVSTSEG